MFSNRLFDEGATKFDYFEGGNWSFYCRTYALYKLIMVCVYQNRSFPILINHLGW